MPKNGGNTPISMRQLFGHDLLAKAFQDEDITPQQAVKKLKSKLEARKVKVFQHEGRILYSGALVDHDVQLRALDMLFKITGSYPDPRVNLDLTQPLEIQVIERFIMKGDGESSSVAKSE